MNMKTLLAVLGFVSAGVLATGCSHVGQLREAAAADLRCPKNRVHVLTNSGKTRDVEACGQNATYRYDEGEWQMIARGVVGGPSMTGAGQPVKPGASAPPTQIPVNQTPTGTPSQPPGTPSQPPPNMPPPAAGQKNI